MNPARPALGRKPKGDRCVFCGRPGDRIVWTSTAGRILVCQPCRSARFPTTTAGPVSIPVDHP